MVPHTNPCRVGSGNDDGRRVSFKCRQLRGASGGRKNRTERNRLSEWRPPGAPWLMSKLGLMGRGRQRNRHSEAIQYPESGALFFQRLASSGELVVIDGLRASACTIVLSAIPHDKICVTSRAALGFHAAWGFGEDGRTFTDPEATLMLYSMYPTPVRHWITPARGSDASNHLPSRKTTAGDVSGMQNRHPVRHRSSEIASTSTRTASDVDCADESVSAFSTKTARTA